MTNAKMKLISLAQARSKKEEDEKSGTSIETKETDGEIEYDDYCKQCNEVDVVKTVKGELKVIDTFVKNVRTRYQKLLEMLENIRDDTKGDKSQEETLEYMFRENGRIIKLNLDDAVTVVRKNAQGPQLKPIFTMADV